MLFSCLNRSNIGRSDSAGRKALHPFRKYVLGLGILACSGVAQAFPTASVTLDDTESENTGCLDGVTVASHCAAFAIAERTGSEWRVYNQLTTGTDLPLTSPGNDTALFVVNNLNQAGSDQKGIHLQFGATNNATLDGRVISSPYFIRDRDVKTKHRVVISYSGETFEFNIERLNGSKIVLAPAANTDPVITEGESLDLLISEDTAGIFTLNATDAEGDTLGWFIDPNSQGEKGSASVSSTPIGNSQQISYNPLYDANGNDSFVVLVEDINGGKDTITVNVTISPVNDAPYIDYFGDDPVVVENRPFDLPLTIFDVEQDEFTVGLKNNQPDWLSIAGDSKIEGMVSTVASDLNSPNTVISDHQGNLLVIENVVQDNNGLKSLDIQKITPAGVKTKLASLTSMLLNNAAEVVVDSVNNLYVLDRKPNFGEGTPNHLQEFPNIRKVAPDGTVSRINIEDNGVRDLPRYLVGLTIDGSNNLYSYDLKNKEVIRIGSDGETNRVTTYELDQNTSPDQVVDLEVDTGGQQFHLLTSVSHEAGTTMTVHKFADSNGSNRTFTVDQVVPNVSMDYTGTVYYSDTSLHTIKESRPDGAVRVVAGSGDSGNINGIGGAASFNQPYGLFVEKDGDILVADKLNNSIRKINGEPEPFRLAGNPTTAQLGEHDVCITAQDAEDTGERCFVLTVDTDLDGDNIGDSIDSDIDDDGIDNSYEDANGLNPRDASDAAQDSDGDGVSNLQEFTAGTNAQADDYAPIITLENEVILDATALKTRIPDDLASANDALDGAVAVRSNLASTLLAPGKHTVTWSATDAAGNTAEKEQIINIRPIANWQVDQQAAEGNNLTVSLFLNGEAPEYPVVANYIITGSANFSDHNAQSGSLTIVSGDKAQIEVMITADNDSEGDENIIFNLTSISNAVIGKQGPHQILISEQNHAPTVSLKATLDSNNTLARTLFARDGGTVSISADVADVDSDDQHTLAWEADNALAGSVIEGSYVFDPASAGAGVYQVTATATDDANSPASGSAIVTLTIVDELPTLNAQDRDGDGLTDQEEGTVDIDGDNVPDFADNVEANNLLAMYPLGGEPVEGAWFVESQAGLNLKLNVYGSNSGDYSPLVADDDLVDNNDTDKSDNGFIYDNGIFDFVVSNIPVQGQSVNVIIPQVNAIPAGAVYRKELNGRWDEFVENANNKVGSAAGERGVCPPPGSDEYQQGLTAGHYCVQLTIEDGGANDADGKADGNIVDPGGVAAEEVSVEEPGNNDGADNPASDSVTTIHSRKGGAFGLLLVSLFGAAYYLRRRIVTPFTQR